MSEADEGWLRFVSMSTTSSRVTRLLEDRSRREKASRIERIWEGGRVARGSVFNWERPIGMMVATLELRVGDVGGSRAVRVREGASPRGVQKASFEVGVEVFWSLDGDVMGVCCCFVGEARGAVGVAGRIVVDGEEGESGRRKGEAGDSGWRNGELRGEP